MKKILTIIITLFLPAMFIYPDTIEWKINRHVLPNNNLEKEINEMAVDGYLPAGIEVNENKYITVLYVKTEQINYSQWTLRYFDNLTTFEQDCTKVMKEGWLPTGMSKGKTGVYILFSDTELSLSAWVLKGTKNNYDSIKAITQKQLSEGFICMDVSLGEDNVYWLLFIKPTTSFFKRNELLIAYNRSDKIVTALDEKIKQNYIPFGITFKDEMCNILLVK